MTALVPFVDDGDFRLFVGDALEVLRQLPDGSVDCCVTSPPYWGLRDYGTANWVGGDPDCDHMQKVGGTGASTLGQDSGGNRMSDEGRVRSTTRSFVPYRDVCRKCGATRVDRQLGLEASPAEYVEGMVAVFREVRRVLTDAGTCWLNLGDSYASDGGRGWGADSSGLRGGRLYEADRQRQVVRTEGNRPKGGDGLKAKDLVGIPWRVAFALQADGWWLRADVVWAKPNPMPESVTDRPTKAHENVFLLAKSGSPSYWVNARRGTLSAAKPAPDYWWVDAETGDESETPVEGWKRENAWRGRDYWFDGEAVREPAEWSRWGDQTNHKYGDRMKSQTLDELDLDARRAAGRNVRSVWWIATQSFPDAHFAVFPQELPRRCILAGCPEWVCRVCGKPRERIVERPANPDGIMGAGNHRETGRFAEAAKGRALPPVVAQTAGWSDCGHGDYRPGVVLDPFGGSGTTALVARAQRRSSVLIELNEGYAAMAARRLQQLSLLSEGAA